MSYEGKAGADRFRTKNGKRYSAGIWIEADTLKEAKERAIQENFEDYFLLKSDFFCGYIMYVREDLYSLRFK